MLFPILTTPPSQANLSLKAAQPKVAFDAQGGMLGTLVTEGCRGCPSISQLNRSLGWAAECVSSAAQASAVSFALQQAPLGTSKHSLCRGDFGIV